MNKIKTRFNQIKTILKFYYYKLYCKVKKIDNNDIWLISERGKDARDNAYFFFKYLVNNHKNLKVYYVIDNKSCDYEKVKKIGNVIDYGSKEHYIYFITAGKLISTHLMGFSPDVGIFNKMQKLNLLRINGKIISLKHGITKDFISALNPTDTKLDLLIAGAKPEYDFLLKKYGFSSEVVKYTGFARFDNLISKKKNKILLMPTFRKWMKYYTNEEFVKTKYYSCINSFLNNDELSRLLEKHNMDLIFYPHYEFQKFINLFKTKSKHIILGRMEDFDVQQLLIESDLLITDYSSVFFDFAYMKKPSVYYQFDYDEYRGNHYKEGYFSYKKNGFGPVYDTEIDVIKFISKCIENNMKLDKKYIDNINKFFAVCDTNNCKRIYDEITKLR